MDTLISDKRVVLVYWKNKQQNSFEVFSNLKNFCLSYPSYNYNTISNYLSKAKVAFENEEVYVERKVVIVKPKNQPIQRRIVPVVRKVLMKDADDNNRDLEYWLSQSPHDRVAAVTRIISQSLTTGQRMDKTKVVKKPIKE